MDFGSVHLMGSNLILSPPEAVTQLETQISATMPSGYKEFVTTLGLGVLNDTIRVYMPKRILREYQEFQTCWREHYFWEAGCDVLTKETVLDSIIIADTGNGDEVIFHPAATNKLYLLPRHSEEIFLIGSTLDEAIHWILNWDVLFQDEEEDDDFWHPEGIYFEPFPAELDQ